MGLLNVQEATSRVVSTYFSRQPPQLLLALDAEESRQAFVATRQGLPTRRCYNGGPSNPPT
jgi:hypothetical protein